MADDNGRARNALVAKLSQFAPLSDQDVRLLETLCSPEERFRAGASIVVEGETPRSAFVLTRGMACRFRLMPDGKRQILTILMELRERLAQLEGPRRHWHHLRDQQCHALAAPSTTWAEAAAEARSEERRVGKECRA